MRLHCFSLCWELWQRGAVEKETPPQPASLAKVLVGVGPGLPSREMLSHPPTPSRVPGIAKSSTALCYRSWLQLGERNHLGWGGQPGPH